VIGMSKKRKRTRNPEKTFQAQDAQSEAISAHVPAKMEEEGGSIKGTMTNGHNHMAPRFFEASLVGGTTQAPWTVSGPMGGRMTDIDPVFSSDEEYAFPT